MASLLKKQNGRLLFDAKKAHFFKIILDRSIRDGKLGIPKKFVREYGNHLSSPVLLKVGNGKTWKIGLSKCDDGIWLQKGWQEFVHHYSLVHGYLLVFEFHQRNTCHFNVIIFDNSSLEIDYPMFTQIVNERNLEEECREPKIKENDDGFKSKSPCYTKKLEVKRGYGSIADSDGIVVKKQRLNEKEKARLVRRANAMFESTNPYFMLVMQPSYIFSSLDKDKDRVNIPPSFAVKYFKQKNGEVTLNVLDGRSWSASYSIVSSGNITQTLATISRGWRMFARDNQLEVGDVCAFELIENTKTTFQVAIFKCNQDAGL
ncbi:B3 domain-containing transcription factor VRN1-like [Mercurialis annua]|uniref:B3 domain-containing transcription factor VRN1-like n=1 Tax=Mercurialis annua TaxID=3986 RepID=UPI00215F47EC|nr:B3 domain-containing transcription factor VRN1-like [Mercurialis annua]